MREQNTDESNDDRRGFQTEERDKRERDIDTVSQQAGQASGTEERPLKNRKFQSENNQNITSNEDPVELARKALDMFRKEVESDGDYEEPDTTPGDIEVKPGHSKVKERGPVTSSTRADTSNGAVEARKASRWGNAGRQPMISQEDDPSIL